MLYIHVTMKHQSSGIAFSLSIVLSAFYIHPCDYVHCFSAVILYIHVTMKRQSSGIAFRLSVVLSIVTGLYSRHRRGRTGTRETTKELVRQRQGLDGDDLPRPPGPVGGRQQNSLEEDVCFFCPQVPPTTAKVEGLSE